MKTSQLIALLADQISTHGDKDVVVRVSNKRLILGKPIDDKLQPTFVQSQGEDKELWHVIVVN